MNRIQDTFNRSTEKVLSVYFTAGFPCKEDTSEIIQRLSDSGVDMVEIGIPFSDPMADGEVIQRSSEEALENGMTLSVLFDQIEDIRTKTSIPLILMGYFNTVLRYGVVPFCERCKRIGIDGVILPDLPLEIYEASYRKTFEAHGLTSIFLITPDTPEDRIRQIDRATDGFIYLVSSAATTGGSKAINTSFLERMGRLNLKNRLVVGFGIKNRASFDSATEYTDGAIIGSAFIETLRHEGLAGISTFIKGLRG